MSTIIYKYVPINKFTLALLIKKKQWVSDPRTFNDPFEFVKRPIARFLPEKGLDLLSLDERQIQERMEAEVDKFGVVCFSKEPKNVLLWSHYADNHQGLCLGFDIAEGKGEFHQVEYRDNIEVFNYTECVESFEQNSVKQMTAKGLHWEYEEEIRQVFPEKGVEVDYPGPLVEVIFGCKCSNTDIELIWELAYGMYGDDITFSKMTKESHFYRLMKSEHNKELGNKTIPNWFYE